MNAARRARELERASQMIPASWDWQKKSKNLASVLAECLFLPCLIRDANAPVPPSIRVNQGNLGLNKILMCRMIMELGAGNRSFHFRKTGETQQTASPNA